MNLSLGITPEVLWSWVGSLSKKIGLWILSGRKRYLYFVCFIIVLIVIYKLLDKSLFNYYRGKYEKENSL